MKHLRAWNLGDASDLAKAMNNEKVHEYLRDGLPFPYTEKDAVAFISRTTSAPKDSQYSWAIHVGGKAVGNVDFFRKDNIYHRTAELGYFLAEPYWGKGIVTNAVKEACAYVFANTDIIRISAESFSHNIASCRVLEKAGFVLEGVLKKNAIKHGEIIDTNIYALIKE